MGSSRSRRLFVLRGVPTLAGTALLVAAPPAAGQVGTPGALENFEPTPAGDSLFGVPSPTVDGHLALRAKIVFDDAARPLTIVGPQNQQLLLVSQQGYLHGGVSFDLWNRVQVSADMPVAIIQSGDSPVINGQVTPSPSGVTASDLRFGGRVSLFGQYRDPFQLGIGGYLFLPTAPADSYAGDGAVRTEPQLLLGGRLKHFVWSALFGATLRASEHPDTINGGAGAAVVLGEDFFQIGPELTIAAPVQKDTSVITSTLDVTSRPAPAMELLLAAKVRIFKSFVLGAGAGPGLTHGYGTPTVFGVGSIGYEPLPAPPAAAVIEKEDLDGELEAVDVCASDAGCPPDRDHDGIPDAEDACPDVAGVHSDDPKTNGCPAPTPEPVKIEEHKIVLVDDIIHFDVDSPHVHHASWPVLQKVAGVIDAHPEVKEVVIEGHADEVGTDEHNLVLSRERAEAVKRLLVKFGVDPGRLSTIGYGERRPKVSGHQEEEWRQNRRVEFNLGGSSSTPPP